ncbi:Enhancer of polycomb-like protein 1 [Rhizophlyctis rosea]|nr:Enhancer of polycomb-like protein 1 [Rhizophlyctis rosea]
MQDAEEGVKLDGTCIEAYLAKASVLFAKRQYGACKDVYGQALNLVSDEFSLLKVETQMYDTSWAEFGRKYVRLWEDEEWVDVGEDEEEISFVRTRPQQFASTQSQLDQNAQALFATEAAPAAHSDQSIITAAIQSVSLPPTKNSELDQNAQALLAIQAAAAARPDQSIITAAVPAVSLPPTVNAQYVAPAHPDAIGSDSQVFVSSGDGLAVNAAEDTTGGVVVTNGASSHMGMEDLSRPIQSHAAAKISSAPTTPSALPKTLATTPKAGIRSPSASTKRKRKTRTPSSSPPENSPNRVTPSHSPKKRPKFPASNRQTCSMRCNAQSRLRVYRTMDRSPNGIDIAGETTPLDVGMLFKMKVGKKDAGVEEDEAREVDLIRILDTDRTESQQEVIPTPTAATLVLDYAKFYPPSFQQPSDLIRFDVDMTTTMGCPYHLSEEDDMFVARMKVRAERGELGDDKDEILAMVEDEDVLEYWIWSLEKAGNSLGSLGRPPSVEECEGQIRSQTDQPSSVIVPLPALLYIYEHWKQRRYVQRDGKGIMPRLKIGVTGRVEDKDDPYAVFRERPEEDVDVGRGVGERLRMGTLGRRGRKRAVDGGEKGVDDQSVRKGRKRKEKSEDLEGSDTLPKRKRKKEDEKPEKEPLRKVARTKKTPVAKAPRATISPQTSLSPSPPRTPNTKRKRPTPTSAASSPTSSPLKIKKFRIVTSFKKGQSPAPAANASSQSVEQPRSPPRHVLTISLPVQPFGSTGLRGKKTRKGGERVGVSGGAVEGEVDGEGKRVVKDNGRRIFKHGPRAASVQVGSGDTTESEGGDGQRGLEEWVDEGSGEEVVEEQWKGGGRKGGVKKGLVKEVGVGSEGFLDGDGEGVVRDEVVVSEVVRRRLEEVGGRMVPDDHTPYAVWVYPGMEEESVEDLKGHAGEKDSLGIYNEEIWWAAVVVPKAEVDSSMPRKPVGAVEEWRVVKYFEKGSYSVVPHSHLRLLTPLTNPTDTPTSPTSFFKAHFPAFKRPYLSVALSYAMDPKVIEGVPRFKWRFWGDATTIHGGKELSKRRLEERRLDLMNLDKLRKADVRAFEREKRRLGTERGSGHLGEGAQRAESVEGLVGGDGEGRVGGDGDLRRRILDMHATDGTLTPSLDNLNKLPTFTTTTPPAIDPSLQSDIASQIATATAHLTAQLQAVMLERDQLRQMNDVRGVEVGRSKSEVEGWKGECERLQGLLGSAREREAELKRQLEEMRGENQKLGILVKEGEGKEGELENLRERVAGLESEVGRLRGVAEERDGLRKEVDLLKRTVESLKRVSNGREREERGEGVRGDGQAPEVGVEFEGEEDGGVDLGVGVGSGQGDGLVDLRMRFRVT